MRILLSGTFLTYIKFSTPFHINLAGNQIFLFLAVKASVVNSSVLSLLRFLLCNEYAYERNL
jgi:hypothetical protein